MIGKKTITDTIATRDACSPWNQMFVIGARAMIGIEFAVMATGSSACRALAQRAVAKAARIPSRAPVASPPTDSVAV